MSGSNPLSTALSQVTASQYNPVQAMGNALSVASKVYDLRTQQANQAIGSILQQATDQNGNVDYEKAGQLAAQAGPVVQMGMQSYLQNASVMRGQQLAQGLNRNQAVGNAIIGALNGTDDGLHDRVVGGLQQLVSNGVMTQDQATRAALQLPSDAAGLRQRLTQLQTSLAPPDLQQQQIYGQPFNYTQPGGQLAGGTRSLQTGALTAANQQGIPQGLGPEGQAQYQQWLLQTVDVPDLNKTLPNGQPNPNYMRTTPMTRGDYLKAQGVNPSVLWAQSPQGGNPTGTTPLGTGRLPAALTNPNKPQQTTTPATSASPQSAAPVGARPSPGEEQLAKDAPARFQAESDADTQAQNQQAILGNMLSDTTQFTTGPLAGIVGKVRNLAGNLGLNINTDAQSAKESFNKLAAGLANAQGAGSDARMNVNISANPHEELSPAGVDLILRQLQGNTDYLRARATLARQWPSKSDFTGFQDSIKDLDPRVFQLTRMTGDQRQTYWKSLDNQTQKQLGGAIKKAKDLGVLGG